MKMATNLKITGASILAAASFTSCAPQLVGEFTTGGINAQGEYVPTAGKAAAIKGGNGFTTARELTFKEEYPCGTPECAPSKSRIVAGGSLKQESGSTTLAKIGQFAGGVGQAALGGAAVAGKLQSKTENNVEGSSSSSVSGAHAEGGKGGQGGTAISDSNASASAGTPAVPCD